ncbi:cell wall-binding protein [Clostridium carboxidivorans P7]|uniref:Putative cell wall binding repeat 2-containing protein n=1 Tax=Clostridium carboxidivorans P7 TaxID=536227 RepID=C6PR67_9CLOT|nr:cell wall-binding repeat-containing protein [Clostridium carboxidivorans]AKN29533.1 cell wall-binding protein [Clostridium carboxidivorans P7]EET88291.1 putative cell wall binding repeat 2-containing protein [Clostridium carboxidivorans P7]EFG89541.1 hypothetical protein CLCAR_0703 [Clostridium carboxidivorans P7]
MKSKKLLSTILLLSILTLQGVNIGVNKVHADSNQVQDITRLGGADRFDTSAKIASYGWSHSDNVVLADAEGNDAFADAITGTSLAYYLDCPILLTNVNSTPDVIKQEITKLGAKNIYILGGTGVVSKSQENLLKSSGYNVKRISGLDRYETACKAADELNSKSKITKVYIAPGNSFQYALTAAPYAARENAAILFADGNSLNNITKNELVKLGIKDVSIIGTYSSYTIESQLKTLGINYLRVNGTTCQSVASNLMNVNGNNVSGMAVASDSIFPDALSGSVIAAKNNYSILLTGKNFNYTVNDNMKHAIIYGQAGAVSESIENHIKNAGYTKDISDDEIYQLYENSQVVVEDIFLSIDRKEKIYSDNGKLYFPTSQQYSTKEKIENSISNYYTKDYVPTIMKRIPFATINDRGVLPEGNIGWMFIDSKETLKSRNNIDSNTIEVNYAETSSMMLNISNIKVTLKFEDNRWKIFNIERFDQ